MSGANAAQERLLREVLADRPRLIGAIQAVQRSDTAFRKTTDLTEGMRESVRLVLALGDLEDAVKQCAATARAALATIMHESGAVGIRTDTHIASTRDPQRSVVITGAIPGKFMRQPPMQPDKHALHKALTAGETIEGAHLSNGGPPVLTLRPIKE
jgi:hypothetical protein